jgi:hypothetical protein
MNTNPVVGLTSTTATMPGCSRNQNDQIKRCNGRNYCRKEDRTTEGHLKLKLTTSSHLRFACLTPFH